jgi:hypothetical protein
MIPGSVHHALIVAGNKIAIATVGLRQTMLLIRGRKISNGGGNDIFADTSGNNVTVTGTGTIGQGTFGASGFTPSANAWSPYFGDGNANGWSVPNAQGNFAAGLFTVELWAKCTNNAQGESPLIGNHGGAAANLGWLMYFNSLNQLGFIASKTGASWDYQITTTYIPPSNVWVHYAVVRTSTTNISLYANGQLVGSKTMLAADAIVSQTTGKLYIGNFPFFGTGNRSWPGNISDVRILATVAAYSGASYSVPNAPAAFVTSNAVTKLLCLQGEIRAKDNVTPTPIVMTAVGTPYMVPDSPFITQAPQAWTDATYGGSAYFDGGANYVAVNNFITGGAGSVYLNNPTTKQYLEIPAAAGTFAAGNFTIECFVNFDTVGGPKWIVSRGGAADMQGWLLYIDTPGQLRFLATTTSGSWTTDVNTTFYPDAKTWYHFAVVRNGNVYTVYVNGISYGAVTVAGSLYAATGNVRIGDYANNASTNNMSGYISNFRIVKGTAVYTAAFVPPVAALAAVANTSALTCQSDTTIGDASANAYAITNFGTVTTTNKNYPLGYLNTATAAWTIECWLYPTEVKANNVFYGDCDVNGTHGSMWLALDANNKVTFNRYTAASTFLTGTSTNAVVPFQWNHVVVSRSAASLWISINGTTGANTGTVAAMRNTGSPTVGAKGRNTAGGTFHGMIGSFRFLNASYYNVPGAYTVPATTLAADGISYFLLNWGNADVIDETGHNTIQTVNGAKLTTEQARFGGVAVDLRNGAYLRMPTTPDLYITNGNFTIEAWIYISAYQTGGTAQAIWAQRDNGSSGNVFYLMPQTGQLAFWSNGTQMYQSGTTETVPLNTWVHVAVCRNGTAMYGFINGVKLTTGSSALWVGNNVPYTQYTYIGNSTFAESLNGFIDDLCLVRGTAKYNGDFTPIPLSYMLDDFAANVESVALVEPSLATDYVTVTTFKVTNRGTTSLSSPVITSSNPAVVLTHNWSTLAPNQQATITLTWTSTTPGTYTGNVTIDCGYAKTVVVPYSGTSTLNYVEFNYTGAITNWTVPSTASYMVEVYGARAGDRTNRGGDGPGAYLKSIQAFTAGDVKKLLVGMRGVSSGEYGSGGGGTFMSTSANAPILVAGGGGGGNFWNGGAGGTVANDGDRAGKAVDGTAGGGASGFSVGANSFTAGGGVAGYGFGGAQGSVGGGGYTGGDLFQGQYGVWGNGGGSYTSGTMRSAIDSGSPLWDGKITIRW